MIKYNFVKVSTYEHLDGFNILKREDTGQEVSRQDFKMLERISVENNNILTPPKDTNSLLFLEQKIEGGTSLRNAYYIHLKNMPDDDIRSFCKRKVFDINGWISDMREIYGNFMGHKENSA